MNMFGDSYVVTINKPPLNIDEVTVGLYGTTIIDRLDCYGKVNLENWSDYYVWLTIPQSNPPYPPEPNCLANHGDLNIDDRINITADVRNLPGATLVFGKHIMGEHINIFGNLYNEAGATILCDAGELLIRDGSLVNAGMVMITPHSGLSVYKRLYNSGGIEIYGGECSADDILDNDSVGTIEGFGVVYAGPPLINKGRIYASGGSLAVATEGQVSNLGVIGNSPGASLNIKIIDIPGNETNYLLADANNLGKIEVNAGGSVVFDCNLVNDPNALINLLGGTVAAEKITQKPGATLQGFGGITTDVLISPDGIIKFTGPTNIVGDVNISEGATLEVSDGTTLITGHCTCNEGTIHMIGGAIILQGGFTNNNCRIVWEPGLYTNVADFNLDGKVNLKDFAYFADTWLWESLVH
jgi:hypothetical protein